MKSLEADAIVPPLGIFTKLIMIYVQVMVIKSYGTLCHLLLDVGGETFFWGGYVRRNEHGVGRE